MKYLLLFTSILLLAVGVYADITQTVTGGDYLVGKVGSTERVKYGNQTNAKSAAAKLSETCTCDVEINQPTIVYRTLVKGSSSSVAISSKATSSVATSIPAGLVGVVFLKPESKYGIKKYWLLRMNNSVAKNEQFTSAGDSVVYSTTPPVTGDTWFIAAEDQRGVYSKFEPVEF